MVRLILYLAGIVLETRIDSTLSHTQFIRAGFLAWPRDKLVTRSSTEEIAPCGYRVMTIANDSGQAATNQAYRRLILRMSRHLCSICPEDPPGIIEMSTQRVGSTGLSDVVEIRTLLSIRRLITSRTVVHTACIASC